MKHSVIIKWGSMIPDEERPEDEYIFDTKEELDAFMQGVAEAEGWQGYEVLHDSRNDFDPEEPLPL